MYCILMPCMRTLFCIIFIFLSACGPQPDLEPTQVEYKITPQNRDFLVEINHNAQGQTTLMLPNSNAYLSFSRLARTKDHPIRYTVIPKPRESIEDTVINLDNGYFQTVGHGLIACIGQDLDQNKSIKIIWNAPSDWRFESSFKEQKFEANCQHLRNALYVGGNNLKIQETWFGTLAITGSFKNLTIPDFERALEQNMKRVLNFWKAKPDSHYLVSIRGTDGTAHGGTAQFQSFQLDLSRDQKNDVTLDRLIAHEYFHNWNGLKINQAPTKDPVGHLDVWWFIEGFTDYYAYLLTFKDLEESQPGSYMLSFDEQPPPPPNVPLFVLKIFAQDPLRKGHVFHVPYVYGRRLAALLDQEIYAYSGRMKRLENLMHEIIGRSQNPSFYLTNENILKTLCEGNYLNCTQAKRLIQRYVVEGDPTPIPVKPLI